MPTNGWGLPLNTWRVVDVIPISGTPNVNTHTETVSLTLDAGQELLQWCIVHGPTTSGSRTILDTGLGGNMFPDGADNIHVPSSAGVDVDGVRMAGPFVSSFSGPTPITSLVFSVTDDEFGGDPGATFAWVTGIAIIVEGLYMRTATGWPGGAPQWLYPNGFTDPAQSNQWFGDTAGTDLSNPTDWHQGTDDLAQTYTMFGENSYAEAESPMVVVLSSLLIEGVDGITATPVDSRSSVIATQDGGPGFTAIIMADLVPSPPIATNETYTLTDVASPVAAPGVLANDRINYIQRGPIDPGATLSAGAAGAPKGGTWRGYILGDVSDPTLTVTLVRGPLYGSLTLNSDGSFEYSGGPDTFVYTVHASDPQVPTDDAATTITAEDGVNNGTASLEHISFHIPT